MGSIKSHIYRADIIQTQRQIFALLQYYITLSREFMSTGSQTMLTANTHTNKLICIELKQGAPLTHFKELIFLRENILIFPISTTSTTISSI